VVFFEVTPRYSPNEGEGVRKVTATFIQGTGVLGEIRTLISRHVTAPPFSVE
jgi:hypothetical protein